MNRAEAMEHFTARVLDKEDKGTPFLAISAYVTAGILTDSDYKKLVEMNQPRKAWAPKKPRARLKWDTEVHGRRGMIRRHHGQRVVEWVDPEPEGWTKKMIADLRRTMEATGAIRVS